ncbi:MAG: hypothetical protein ACXVCP_05130 [Bdellovibrio sp.]
MRKKVLLAMSTFVFFGAVKSMAASSSEEEFMNMNAASKVEAVQILNANMDKAAAQIKEIQTVNDEIQQLINKLGENGEGLQANSLGQISFLGDTYLQEAIHAKNFEGVQRAHEKAMKLNAIVEKIKQQR